MKSLQLLFLLLTTFFLSCNTSETGKMHETHKGLANNFKHQNIIVLKKSYAVDQGKALQLKSVFRAYLEIKAALIDNNPDAVDKAVEVMEEKVEKVNSSAFSEEGKEAWEQHSGLYLAKLKEMKHIEGIFEKRTYFAHLSEIMYCTLKSFEIPTKPVYVFFCPMAFKEKGAYWMSDSKSVDNPYFGSKMKNCGEVKEEI